VERVAEEEGAGSFFKEESVTHDGDAVRDLGDDGEIVGDEEHGEAEALAEIGEEVEDLRLDGDVEGGGGLVGNEQAGAIDDGHGDEDALALSAGELMGVVAETGRGRGQGDGRHGLEDAVADLVAGEIAVVSADRLGDLLADGEDGVEGGHGLLKDHGDFAAAEAADGFRREGEEVAAVVVDGAGDGSGGIEESEDGEGGNGFAGAGFTDEAEGFSGGDGEGEGADGFGGAEADGEVVDLEERHGNKGTGAAGSWEGGAGSWEGGAGSWEARSLGFVPMATG
jgi:hypothetical protein